jgi:hypothetical protein
MVSEAAAELFLRYGCAARVPCPEDGGAMAPAVVDGYGVLLWWCPRCRRAVDDATLRRELASRLSCKSKMH